MKNYLIAVISILLLFSCKTEKRYNPTCFLKCGDMIDRNKGIFYAGRPPFTKGIRLVNKSKDKVVYSFNDFEVNGVTNFYQLQEVMMSSKEGVCFKLAHLDTIFVKVGQRIESGDTIGLLRDSSEYLFVKAFNKDSVEVSPRQYLDCECGD